MCDVVIYIIYFIHRYRPQTKRIYICIPQTQTHKNPFRFEAAVLWVAFDGRKYTRMDVCKMHMRVSPNDGCCVYYIHKHNTIGHIVHARVSKCAAHFHSCVIQSTPHHCCCCGGGDAQYDYYYHSNTRRQTTQSALSRSAPPLFQIISDDAMQSKQHI